MNRNQHNLIRTEAMKRDNNQVKTSIAAILGSNLGLVFRT